MKTAWVTLHCKDKAILDTVLCALFVEDEETNHFEWRTLTVNEAVKELIELQDRIIELEGLLAQKDELYQNTHAKLVRLNERFISNFL